MDRRIPPYLRAVPTDDQRLTEELRAIRTHSFWLSFACLSVVGACDASSDAGPWVEEEGYRWRELAVRGRSEAGFRVLDAERLGIEFQHHVSQEARLGNRILAEGHGMAIGDVDGDERPDIFFAGFGAPSALYRNLGGWRFEDVTEEAGVALDDVLARGAALADTDGDGDLDLVVTVHAGPNLLLEGVGDGRFAEAREIGLPAAPSLGSTTPALADTDGDGDLDLYVANYKTRQADDIFPPSVLDLGLLQRGPDGGLVVPPEVQELYAEHYRVEFDGRFVRRYELGEPDEYYLNDGSGRFLPTPDAFQDTAGIGRGWGLAARFSDWDGDGDADLYVANDFDSEDGVWLNEGDGTFVPVGSHAIRTTSLSSMSIDAGDLDRDGRLDLLTTDMRARDPFVHRRQTPSSEPEADPPGVIDTRLQVNRNALQLNRGDGTFAEAAWELGIAASDWTWGAVLVDADLDGWDDALMATGHAWNLLDGDSNVRVSSIRGLPAREALALFEPLAQPNVAYRGGPNGFTDVSTAWGWGESGDIAHGVALGDLDGDGDPDAVVTRLDSSPAFYRNESGRDRIAVRLVAPAPNTRGVGARIRLLGHPVGPQTREITAGGRYLSSSDASAWFAAPRGDSLTLEIEWPDGARSQIPVNANREYEVHWTSASLSAPQRQVTMEPANTTSSAGATHFEDVSVLLGHTHTESDFDERARQPLLPGAVGRPGPGISWIDVDRDGDADLLVGNGLGSPPMLSTNESGSFGSPRPLPIMGITLTGDVTSILPHTSDESGPPAILLGVSGYEAGPRTPAQPLVMVPTLYGEQPRDAIDHGGTDDQDEDDPSGGPLAQADIDGDGDLDLFLGGAPRPGAYPLAAGSRLYVASDHAEGGCCDLRHDLDRSRVFAGAGIVSGAVFSDLDADGDPDLALAVAWGPVRAFRNDGGHFTEVTEQWGLDIRGRWNGIASGDFDGDGALDLVATAWGRNVDLPSEYSLFYGDMNRDGRIEPIEGVEENGSWYALRKRDELAVRDGLPELIAIPYSVYAETPLPVLLPGLDPAQRHDVEELRHMVFLNRGETFEATPLPPAAQRAPAFGVAVGDLDGDAKQDLVLAQNFYAGPRGEPRYASGRGLWLRGDGAGGFTAVPGDSSGITVYGGGRGVALADYDRDGRVDIAYGVNGGQTRMFRNRGARRGLRVTLLGPSNNPDTIGARLRIEDASGALGPVHEVKSGEGYLSRDEAVITLGLPELPRSLRVIWPWGSESSVPLERNVFELTVRGPPQ